MSHTINELSARLTRLTRNGKNIESQGVLRKIRREIRHINSEKKQ